MQWEKFDLSKAIVPAGRHGPGAARSRAGLHRYLFHLTRPGPERREGNLCAA